MFIIRKKWLPCYKPPFGSVFRSSLGLTSVRTHTSSFLMLVTVANFTFLKNYGSVNSKPLPLSSKMLQMLHGGASSRVQVPPRGFWNSANGRPTGQDQNFILMIYDGSDNRLQINVSLLEPVNTPIAFYHLKRSKTAALSRTVQSIFFPTSLIHTWKQQCKYLHILGRNHILVL